MSSVHIDIPHIKAHVQEKILYDMDPKCTKYIPCTIVAFSSYPGHAPTFHILINNSSLFYYVPSHLLLIDKPSIDDYYLLTLKELVYHNCPDHKFSLTSLDYLSNKPIHVWIKSKQQWVVGKYLWTIDWYRGNDVLHAIKLENGQIAFMPNHKISLDKKELPNYKKLKQEWKV